MTDDELKNDRAIIDAATPGEWWMCENDGGICSGPEGPNALEVGNIDFNQADTDFVMAARQRWPAALAEIERLKQEDRAALNARNILGAALIEADGEHSSSLVDCANRAAELVAENKQLRAELARWEALGERHDLKLREPGCKCDREEGDSPCPVHELWALCQEPPTGVGETGCRWIGKMSDLVDRDGIKHCPNCNSTAIVEDLEEDKASV